ncbi:MAG TPA: trypsin-like peptidase domain-containing protein, partial [Rhodoferax sp.]
APHSVFGSCFLIGYQGRVFVITARHVLRPDGELSPMCVRSPSGWLLPLKDVYFAPISEVPDDFADLAIVEVDMKLLDGDMGQTRILPLRRDDEDWLPWRYVSRFAVVGFPNEQTFVDYETGEVVEGRVELVGGYNRPAESAHLHELVIENPLSLESYSGFSGGPVLMLKRSVGAQTVPVLCGVAIQGTAVSRTVRFIERSILVSMLDAKLAFTE